MSSESEKTEQYREAVRIIYLHKSVEVSLHKAIVISGADPIVITNPFTKLNLGLHKTKPVCATQNQEGHIKTKALCESEILYCIFCYQYS